VDQGRGGVKAADGGSCVSGDEDWRREIRVIRRLWHSAAGASGVGGRDKFQQIVGQGFERRAFGTKKYGDKVRLNNIWDFLKSEKHEN